MNSRPQADIARILLIIVILSLLIFGSLYIVHPFLPALIWATMIVVATWPVMIGIEKRVGGRRWIAVTVMLVGLLVVVVLPLYGAVSTIAEHGRDITDQTEALPDYTLPRSPRWPHEVPLAGERSAREWQRLSDAGRGGILAQVQPDAIVAAKWLLSQAGAVGVLAIHLVLTVVIAGILYAQGEAAANRMVRFATRIAAERGAAAVRLSALSIRAVALGIVVTAAAQAALGGLGLYVAGVPGAGVLTALILILCLAQIGPALPLIGAAVWLFYHDQHIATLVLAVWTLLIMMLDKVRRPLLIKRGVDLSLLLILTGVLGGVIAFGIVGLFIGPMILAVTFTLLQAWIDEEAPSAPIEPALMSTGDRLDGEPQHHRRRAAHDPSA
ncbi:AI-2E family transporter YdiK [Paraburkholderia sp. SIMBA_030]|uniref:AI-2E family transporter YdiK n=1 Tax=Paraburkholderia sp. SIMBA_030 TaxID=3085773 RepID=UPI00397DF80F